MVCQIIQVVLGRSKQNVLRCRHSSVDYALALGAQNQYFAYFLQFLHSDRCGEHRRIRH